MSFFDVQFVSIFMLFLSLSDKIYFHMKCLAKKVLKQKRTFPFASWTAASFSIEAAFVLPIFLTVCMMILFYAELFRLETRINEMLYNSSKIYAQYAGIMYGQEATENVLYKAGLNGFSVFAVKKFIEKQLDGEFNKLFSKADRGISYSFVHSVIDENYIDLIVTYNVKFNIPFISLPSIPIVQRCRFHAWTGDERKVNNENQDVIVFITATGQVYHTSRDCTYIKLSIQAVEYDKVPIKRNNGGAKYYKCERCCKNNKINALVYITDNGTRFHNSLNCSELKRTVQEVKLNDVKDTMRECSKCNK